MSEIAIISMLIVCFMYLFGGNKTKKIEDTSFYRLIEAAKNDTDFQNELNVHEPKYYKLKHNATHLEQAMYAMIYMGWLIGKGKYNESDFDKKLK